MTWFKVDDRVTFHRKTLEAGNAAMGAWMRLGAWAAGYETDGVIPVAVLMQIATGEEVAALCDAGFLKTLPDGSVEMHDFLKYNPSRAELDAQRASYADRQKRHRETRESRVVSRVTERVTPGRDGTGEIQTAEAETELTENDNGSTAREAALTPEESTRVRLISKSDRPPPPTAKPKAESEYDTARRVWVELWSAKYGEKYIFQPASGPGSEDYALQRLGRAAKAASGGRTEQTLRHWVKSFLRDSGARNWLSDNKHPLRSLERDLNKYGLPKAKAVSVNKQSAICEEQVPLSVEEQKKRAESLAGLVGKIGVGR